jgi:hypothetical protein
MSEQDDRQSTVSRSELAARAAAQAQRNQPRALIVLGAVVLLAGVVYLLVGRSALAGAMGERRQEVNSASTVLMQKARLERHFNEQSQGDDRFEPVSNFTTLVENAAQSVGLEPVPTLNRQDENQDGDLTIRTYQYNRVTSRDVEALIGWVAQVEQMVPGVEITRFELTPSRTQWQLAITFVKPELSS